MQIFELFGTILIKDDGIENKLDKIDKKGNQTSKSMGLSFGSMAGAALKLGAILGAGIGIQSMISTAAKGEERMAQMNAVLTSTKGAAGMTQQALVDLATAQSKLSTQSKGANIETENLLLTFTSIGKDVFPQALTTVNDMSQALGQDTKSSAVQLGKALQDPIKGITALSRVGVNFTAQQKEQIKAMVAVGDVAGAQKIILSELGTEFGGSALAASQTFNGQLGILKNSFIGMGGSIASSVLPYLKNFVMFINENMPVIQATLTNLINTIVPKFQEWIALIIKIVTELLPNFGKGVDGAKGTVDLFTVAISTITNILTFMANNTELVRVALIALGIVWVMQTGFVIAHNIALFTHNTTQAVKMAHDVLETGYIIALYIAQGAQTAATWLGVTAQAAFNLVMEMNPIAKVIIVLSLLGAAIYEVVKHWQDICEWIGKAWDWLTKWNGTEAKDKNTTVNTDYTSTGNSSGSYGLPHNASGTDFFQGGLTHINEVGGEIVDLPTGTRIIPHDISMEMAKNSKDAKNNGGLTLTITNFYNNTKQDIQELAEELQFYSNQKTIGGSNNG